LTKLQITLARSLRFDLSVEQGVSPNLSLLLLTYLINSAFVLVHIQWQ